MLRTIISLGNRSSSFRLRCKRFIAASVEHLLDPTRVCFKL